MLSSPLLSGSGQTGLNLTLSADDNNVNVKSALEAIYGAGSCDGKVKVVVTVLPGVTIGSNDPSFVSLNFAGFDYGASLKLVNYGNIYGAGGAGNSGAGGRAMQISRDITINNTTTGKIFGGGGGGGQGGYGQEYSPPSGFVGGGGGGGGGQGSVGGAGGAGQGGDAPGVAGSSGSDSASGVWGAGGYYSVDAQGGRGGQGGGWGQQGETGTDGYGSRTSTSGQVGGQPGKAIYKSSSCTITWLAGNNATQVKGVVD